MPPWGRRDGRILFFARHHITAAWGRLRPIALFITALPADYFISLATIENTLLAFPPINRTVPMTMTRITASITAYSAMSWPSSFDQMDCRVVKIGPPKLA